MRKRLAILAAALVLLAGCARRPGDNLLLRNDSDTPLGLIEMSGAGYSGGACYADGSPIRPRETFGILMDPDDGGAVTLRVWDEEQRTVLAERTFTFDFADGNICKVSYAAGKLSLA